MNTDETETLLDHLTERINANGLRVVSNPNHQPKPEAGELKSLIQTMQGRRRVPGKQKVDEPEPLDAA